MAFQYGRENNPNMIDGGIDDLSGSTTEVNLSFPFILANQLNKIIYISSQDFHNGMPLYTDSGVLRDYLPDVLESYCNSVDNLYDMLSPYFDKVMEKDIKDSKYEPDRRQRYRLIFKSCMCLIKRLGLLPSEKGYSEVFGEKRKT